MKTHHYALSAAFLAVAATSVAAETARMQYATLLAVANIDLTANGVATQSVGFSTRSRLPDVRPSDIRITLETKDGHRTLPLDSDGNFALPVSAALAKENPWISTNQPKGTMVTTAVVTITLRNIEPEFLSGEWRVSYAKLFPLHDVAERLDAVVAKAPDRQTVTATFPGPKTITLYCDNKMARAWIVVGDQRREVRPPKAGQFVLDYSAELIQRDGYIVVVPGVGCRWRYDRSPETATTKIPARATD
jgi:hypothetical protein